MLYILIFLVIDFFNIKQHTMTQEEMNDNLLLAAAKKDLAKVHLLLRQGADVNHKSEFGYTALMIAVWVNDHEIVKLLLSYNADTKIKNVYNNTALSFAISTNNSRLEKLLSYFS